MVDQGGRVKVFMSYSHEDDELKKQLDTHLALLKRLEAIETWSDQEIVPGHDWEATLWEEFEAANLILLLISADFIASDFCFREEMIRAMKRQDSGQARVIPIIIRACDWEGAPFGRLQALPTRAKPVTSWTNRDEAWTDVAIGIRGAVGWFQPTKLASVPAEAGSAPPGTSVPSMSLSLGSPRIVAGLREFSIEVATDRIPEGGYIGFQTLLHGEGLRYLPTERETEVVWPDAEMATAVHYKTSSGLISHGALSGLITFDLSYHAGPLLRIAMQCPYGDIVDPHSHKVRLIPLSEANPNGAGFLTEDRRRLAPPSIGQVDLTDIGVTDFAAELDVVCNP